MTRWAGRGPTTWDMGQGEHALGLDQASRLDFVGDEAMQGPGEEVVDGREADASGRGLVTDSDDLNRVGDQELALVAARAPALGALAGAVVERGLVDLDEPSQGIAFGRAHRTALLRRQQPGRLVGERASCVWSCVAEMPLEWVAIR